MVQQHQEPQTFGATKDLQVRSPAFGADDRIPSRHTCAGENLSPPLEVEGIPAGTQYLALVMDDPDAPKGTFTHWTFWDLPATEASLAEDAPIEQIGGAEGTNDFEQTGYGGPCPPPGHGSHRYRLKVYAQREKLNLPSGAHLEELAEALEGNVLAWGELVGTYERP